jgi:hypothetical protein
MIGVAINLDNEAAIQVMAARHQGNEHCLVDALEGHDSPRKVRNRSDQQNR